LVRTLVEGSFDKRMTMAMAKKEGDRGEDIPTVFGDRDQSEGSN